MRRTRLSFVGAVLAAGAVLASAAPAAFAWEGPITDGQPNLSDDSPAGYFVWHDADGLHLRTHGPKADHVFVADLHSGGRFTDVSPVKLEKDDKVNVKDDGHTLVLKFHTYDGFDGVDFRLDDGQAVKMILKMDHEQARLGSIYLGEDGAHPGSDPFTIER